MYQIIRYTQQKEIICNFQCIYFSIYKMLGYLQSLKAHQTNHARFQQKSQAQVTLPSVGKPHRVTHKWIRYRPMTDQSTCMQRAQNVYNLFWVMPHSSTQHKVLIHELLYFTEGKPLHFGSDWIPWGCRMADAKKNPGVCKETRAHPPH